MININRQLKAIKSKIRAEKDYINRKKIEKHFLIPDINAPEVPISENSLDQLEELRTRGVTKIEGFKDIADYINETYFSPIENKNNKIAPWHRSTLTQQGINTGRTIQLEISFDDQKLSDLFFNSDIIGLVYNYYKRQPYYRNLPVVVRVDFQKNQKIPPQGKFHLDGGLKQISLMLLLNDISKNDTHMEYAIGTNNLRPPRDIGRYSWDDKKIEENNEMYDLIGQKGTAFLFDAGNGFHRAVYKPNSMRKILHLNFTTGHTLSKVKERQESNFDFLNSKPEHIKNVITKIKA